MAILPKQEFGPRVISPGSNLMRRQPRVVRHAPSALPVGAFGTVTNDCDVVSAHELAAVLNDGVGVVLEGFGEVVVVDSDLWRRGGWRRRRIGFGFGASEERVVAWWLAALNGPWGQV